MTSSMNFFFFNYLSLPTTFIWGIRNMTEFLWALLIITTFIVLLTSCFI